MTARAKIRSSGDFPVFLQEMTDLGIISFDTYPADGHSEYFSDDGSHVATKPAYAALPISGTVDKIKFEKDLLAYQMGEMSYPDFCERSTSSGIKKWTADFKIMTCVYLDCNNETVLVQAIP